MYTPKAFKLVPSPNIFLYAVRKCGSGGNMQTSVGFFRPSKFNFAVNDVLKNTKFKFNEKKQVLTNYA
jgi:hypothetical protein